MHIALDKKYYSLYSINMIFPRKLKKKIIKELENELTIVITGMRRVGKTYLLRDIFDGVFSKNKLFLDLEKPESRKIFNEDSYDAVIRNLEILGLSFIKKLSGGKQEKKKQAWIFVDEVQYIKSIPSIIKYLTDHYRIKFIVSGSSSFYLKNLFNESLAGRKAIFHLLPLDFGEFLTFRGKKYPPISAFDQLAKFYTSMVTSTYAPLFEEYINTGGFPQAVLIEDSDRRKSLLFDILHSYLTIDVRTMSDFRGIEELEKLIYLLPSRIGQKLDISRLSSEIGISRITVKNYLTFLQDTFVIKMVRPYSQSPDREISLTPKLYFIDAGLGSVLAEISSGQKFENVVFTHLSRKHNINYYQRKSGVEIDFVVDKEFSFEVKIFGTERDYAKLVKLARSLGINKSYVLTQRTSKEKSLGIIPAFLLGFLE